MIRPLRARGERPTMPKKKSQIEKPCIHDTDQSLNVPCIRGPKHIRRLFTKYNTRRREHKAEAATEEASQSAKIEPT